MPRTGHITGRGIGWRPDLPDVRDRMYAHDDTVPLPAEVRLDETGAMPPIYDQGQLGSCTANALAAAVEYDLTTEGKTSVMPSRLFVYYNERDLEGTTGTDAGACIRDGAKTLAKLGVCPETTWPYQPTRYADRPTTDCYAAAQGTRVTHYHRVRHAAAAWQHALAAGRPITFGFSVYDSFEQPGWTVMPDPTGTLLGGHAVLAVGYAQINGELCWRVRNSWGTSFADGGYFWMPARHTVRRGFASDFWVLQTI